MSYEKYKDELDELLKEPWIIENEKKILAIMKDDSTPKKVNERIVARWHEIIIENAELIRERMKR